MSAFRLLLRGFSILFHGLLTVFLLGVSGLALSGGAQKLSFKMLPWTGDTLVFGLFFGALFGLFALLLALGGKWPALFFLWSLAVAALLLKGYIFSGYYFGHGELRLAVGLIVASWISLPGAWPRHPRRSAH